jgi:estrone sulfotransferase
MNSAKPILTPIQLLKQYLRWFPAKIGLFNKGAYLLQINEILSDDLFIASYPKSGNTWVRFVLANMKSKGEEITFKTIDQYVSDVYTAKGFLNSKKNNRIIKTHQTLFEYYPKTIYIYRDYRDVLISFYHYEKALTHFAGTFEQFIVSKNVNEPFGSWKEHVKKALDFKLKYPEKILLISYESLIDEPLLQLKLIQEFTGLKPMLSIEEINNRCSFSKLKDDETKHSSNFKDISKEYFFREGKKGKWVDFFTTETIHELKKDTELMQLMIQLDYSF